MFLIFKLVYYGGNIIYTLVYTRIVIEHKVSYCRGTHALAYFVVDKWAILQWTTAGCYFACLDYSADRV